MEHVVFFPAPDGAPAFRRVPSLDEAVRLVEHLRNVEGVASVSVHSLAEVPLAFRAYYKVEVPTEASIPQQSVAEPVIEPVLLDDAAADEPVLVVAEDAPAQEPALASGNGHHPQSLGFFA